MLDYTEIYLKNFANYLTQLQVSTSTYKNYLSDIRYYFQWLATSSQPSEQILSLPTLLAFRNSQTSQPLTTTNRRLSALRKLCQYAFSSQLITADPSSQLPNLTAYVPPNPNQDVLFRFAVFLRSQKVSPITIKNYLSDIRHYFSLNTQAEIYISQLQEATSATNKRRLSSLRKFLEFSKIETPTLEPAPPIDPTPLVKPIDQSPTSEIPTSISDIPTAFSDSVKTQIGLKTYLVLLFIITLSLLLLIIFFFLFLPPHPPLINPSPTGF